MAKTGGKKLKTISKAKAVREMDEEKIEREKKMFMWVGVSCVMLVIFIIWIFNLKHQFALNADKSGQNNFNWKQTKAELNQAMAQVKESIGEIKKISQTSAEDAAATSSEPTTEQLNLLKGKLLSEAISSTTASSTIK